MLIISGNPTEDQLKQAWSDLVADYSYSLQADYDAYKLDMMRTIGLLQADVIYIENAVFLLRYRYDADVVQELIKMGYELQADPKDTKAFNQCLDKIVSLSKTKSYDLEQMTEEYNRMEKTTTGKILTVEEFDKNVAMIARYMRYRIDQETTMMDEYMSYLNAYVSELNWRSKKHISNDEEI